MRKYDALGNVLWTQQFGSPGTEEGDGVAFDGLGNVYASGITDGIMNGINAGGSDAFVTKFFDFPGDYNRDLTVDAGDYVVWKKGVGNVVPPCSGGDSNCNGFVENAEYQPWRENYGRTIGGGSIAVGSTYSEPAKNIPESSSFVLVIAALLGVCTMGRQERGRQS